MIIMVLCPESSVYWQRLLHYCMVCNVDNSAHVGSPKPKYGLDGELIGVHVIV